MRANVFVVELISEKSLFCGEANEEYVDVLWTEDEYAARAYATRSGAELALRAISEGCREEISASEMRVVELAVMPMPEEQGGWSYEEVKR